MVPESPEDGMNSVEPAISQTPRQRLPNRRECYTETLAVDGQSFEATVGFDPESGQPRELFLNGGKEGS